MVFGECGARTRAVLETDISGFSPGDGGTRSRAELPYADVSLAASNTALRKMLLSVPPRTGINPYNGYRNSKKVTRI